MSEELRYARTHDGQHVAYQVRGSGSIDLLEIGGFGTLFSLDASDEQPRWRRFEERLRSFSRLIKFDLRGVGYSDPLVRPPTVDDWVADAIAVLDDSGAQRVSILASSFGGFAALKLAALHPNRVDRLVLVNSAARITRTDDYRIGADIELVGELRKIAEPDGSPDNEVNDIDVMAPSIANEEDVRRWWARTSRRGAGPAAAAAMWDIATDGDVRGHLDDVEARTLVVHTADNNFMAPIFGKWLARHLPNAQLAIVPGADQVIWALPGRAVVDEIERFLTGSIDRTSGERTIAAILFTDIVMSTARNSASGDESWLELIARHDDMADGEISRRGGRVIKGLGDGLLAIFPLASDAVDAALAVTEGANEIGLAVRAGLHVAEVDEVDDDVFGLGVSIAARVLGEADGGDVLATRAVVEVLAGRSFSVETRGRFSLKGIDGDWELSSISS